MRHQETQSFFYPEFQNLTLDEVVIKVQEGSFSAKEEVYFRLLPEIKLNVQSCVAMNRKVENDEEVYFSLFYDVTERCISTYSKDKGHFLFYWRNVRRREKMRMLGKLAKSNKPKLQNTIGECEFESSGQFEYFLNYSHEVCPQEVTFCDSEDDAIIEVLDAETMLHYIEERYSFKDRKAVELWMNGYPIKEIAAKIGESEKYTSGRIYTLLAVLKQQFA